MRFFLTSPLMESAQWLVSKAIPRFIASHTGVQVQGVGMILLELRIVGKVENSKKEGRDGEPQHENEDP